MAVTQPESNVVSDRSEDLDLSFDVDLHIDAVELWALTSNLMLVAPKNLRVGARLAGARLKHPEATMIE